MSATMINASKFRRLEREDFRADGSVSFQPDPSSPDRPGRYGRLDPPRRERAWTRSTEGIERAMRRLADAQRAKAPRGKAPRSFAFEVLERSV